MSPMPRDISPELVLVDPELAAFARRHLPEPGWLGRQHLVALESDVGALVTADRARSESAPEARRGWGTTLLLTVAAVSLTLNGFWLAQVVGPGASSSAQAAFSGSPASVVLANDLATSEAATTDLVGSSGVTTTYLLTRNQPALATRVTPVHSRPSRSRVGDGRTRVRGASTNTSGHVVQSKRRAPATSARTIVLRSSQDLRWNAVASATYYDVVLWRDGRRILDLWPTSPRVALPTTHVDHVPQVRLSPGRYLWFVYPGFGPKSARQYGALAGTGVVVIQPKGGNER
jgi:hypothetical protein